MTNWSIQAARELYHIFHWSEGFFDISEEGKLRAFPNHINDKDRHIDLDALAKKLYDEKINFPVLLRFTDILKKRIQLLHHAFNHAIKTYHFNNHYLCAYPIKVNQQRLVVETILDNGIAPLGIETGSKPELLAALAMPKKHMAAIICNGYKDREYIRLALIGQRLGHHVLIILEKFSELQDTLLEAAQLGIEPQLGIRVRLTAHGSSKWQDSNGEKAKFGFSASQLLTIVNTLRQKNRLSLLRVLHFHLGSQIANIADIKKGIEEGVRYYETLRALGAPIDTIDVGGGLGVDYEGTRSRSYYSVNYNIQDYANNIIKTIADTCNQRALPHPQIITESGRAMTAHHALLITNVISVEPAFEATDLTPPSTASPMILHDIWQCFLQIAENNALESYHDLSHHMTEIHALYMKNIIDLQHFAYAEQIYYAACEKLHRLLKPSSLAHRKLLDALNDKLAHKFVCNFSLFQSLPDAWAINQVFPIMPLTGLDKPPTLRGILHDITCDSDGRIDQYVNNYGLESTLPLTAYDANTPYLLGIFLVGAYQEILGDLHNLFGDTNSIHVEVLQNGHYKLSNALSGDTVESTLRQVNFDSKELFSSYQQQLNTTDLPSLQRDAYLVELMNGLKGYTYYENRE